MGMKKVALSTGVVFSFNLSPVNFVEGALLGLYTFKKYKEEKNNKAIDSITLLSETI